MPSPNAPVHSASQAEAVRFVELANPHSWYLSASELNDQAIFLGKNLGKAKLIQLATENRATRQMDAVSRSVFLLAGFALENLLKAFLVFENPSYISNGKLSKRLQSQNLVSLYGAIKSEVQLEGAVRTLMDFQAGLTSWARYPCGLSISETDTSRDITPDLMERYSALFAFLSEKLKIMLSVGWQGPNQVPWGRWTFSGDF